MRFQGAVLVWTLVELLMAMSIIGNLLGLWLSRGPARDAARRMPASPQRRPVLCTLLVFSVVLLAQATASAHFPWLVRSADNQAQMFFGEGLNDRTYQLPLSIAQAEILQIDAHGKSQKLKTTVVEQNDLVGLVSAEAVPADCILVANTTYGLFRGSKLQYTALSLGQLRSDTASYVLPKELALKATVIAASPGIDIAVTWEDKPLSGAKIQLCDVDAKQTAEVETNEAGRATISDEQIHAGLNAIRIGHKVSRKASWAMRPTPAKCIISQRPLCILNPRARPPSVRCRLPSPVLVPPPTARLCMCSEVIEGVLIRTRTKSNRTNCYAWIYKATSRSGRRLPSATACKALPWWLMVKS